MARAQGATVSYVYGIIVINTHVLILGACVVGLEVAPERHSSVPINTRHQTLTWESQGTFIFKLRLRIPLRRVLSFGLLISNTFFRGCYVGMAL